LNNAEKYHFKDFTLNSYRNYIRLAKRKYKFRDYSDFRKEENFVLWRHDVDYSVHAALRLARIDAEERVKSTFFLHLHNEFYNLLELEITELVKEIVKCGHNIGLHFDPNYAEMEMGESLKFEKGILERLFGVKIGAFSVHNPGISRRILEDESYEGMVNCYSRYFRNEVPYCSDSFGIWRHQRLEDALTRSDYPRMQVLTHPEWWTETVTSPKERVWRCIEGRSENNKKRFEKTLRKYEVKVIDW